MAKFVMALDAGTTSNRCILFDEQGNTCSVAQKEFNQYFPKPGWVEHDAGEIWSTQLGVAVEAMSKVGASASDIAAIGITNQRETTIVWDKFTGEPVYRAIVWQCRRTSAYCDSLKERGFVDPVSYTHLDVYKRQGQCISEKSMVQTAVTQVQPLATRSSFNCARLSNSRMLPWAM